MPVNGTQNVLNRFAALQSKLTTEIKELVAFTTSEIELEAIRNAPGPGDPIKTQFGTESQSNIARGRNWTPISQAITSKEINGDGFYKGIIQVESSAGQIAAWVEFGTGQSASSYLSTVEPEWRSLAQLYYINGKGTIINQPYLYPAYLKHRALFVKELNDILKNIKL